MLTKAWLLARHSSVEEGLAEICYLLSPTLAASLGDLTSAHAHAWHVCANKIGLPRGTSHIKLMFSNDPTCKRLACPGTHVVHDPLSCGAHIGTAQPNRQRRSCTPWFPREPLAQNKTCRGTQRLIPTNRMLPPRPHQYEPHVKPGPTMICKRGVPIPCIAPPVP